MDRFHHVATCFALGLAWLCAMPAVSGADTQPAPPMLWVYLGTYTNADSKGIYLAHLDLAAGKLELTGLAGEAKNPSFLTLHPTKPLLYAVGEIWEPVRKDTRNVCAFAIEPKSGKLRLLNQQSTGGAGPCHITVDRTGRCALVANYGGGSVVSLPIQEDGRLGAAASFVQHRGASVNPKRQQEPHAHSITIDSANRFAIAADLGLDKLLVYRLDAATGKFAPHDPPATSSLPGAGPRHFDFHPNGRWAYAINELNSTVTAMQYDASRGTLRSVESISTLPAGYREVNYPADIHVHPSGRFLYGSNRGHDSIAIFAIDPASGKLCALGHEPTRGKTPRNFAIDPTGRYLLAANQDSGNVVLFRIDTETGKLTAAGSEIKVSAPVCVKMRAPLE